MNSPLKKLDQSVFDGLPPEYKFADVDEHGRVFVYAYKPCMKCFDGKLSLIPGNFDATDWQNSLIKRKEIAAKKPLSRGDLVMWKGDIHVVMDENPNSNGEYRFAGMTGKCGYDWVHAKQLTRIGSIRKKIKRLKAQMPAYGVVASNSPLK